MKTHDEIAIETGLSIRRARIYRGWTQEQLAEAVGTKQSSIARAEKGRMYPSLDFLMRIGEALCVDIHPPMFEIPDDPLTL